MPFSKNQILSKQEVVYTNFVRRKVVFEHDFSVT
jgi:hypothetical protein